ncbi:MAG: beta-galactosidase [Spirochaetota bacterium]
MAGLSRFIYGTQYYRAPTPLPSEWSTDMDGMKAAGLDAFQIRIQWRWNERTEGQYRFDDVDELFDLAEKNGHSVIVKFLMETAPDYIFKNYGGTRIGLDGIPLSPGAHGAYYVGGWWPCFDNPDVIRFAERFVRVFAERYKSRKNLLFWNIWNEPVSRPIGECSCEHSRSAYRAWLTKRYGTIESLNDTFGKCWGSFDTIDPPGMAYDYAELFLWRTWSLSAVAARLSFMYAAVKSADSGHPIMSHVGACSVVQDVAQGSDDVQNSAAVDFYGMSYTVYSVGSVRSQAIPFMLCDWMRSVSPYFWAYELYPDWRNWGKPCSIEDYRFKVLSALAGGSKGLLYWQYRSERLGNEDDLSGLVNIDGSFRGITHECAHISSVIKKHGDLLMRANVVDDPIGIVYDLDSDMISRIENTGNNAGPRGFWSFELCGGYPYLYKKSLMGIYALLREMGYVPRFIDSRSLAEKSAGVNVLYLPQMYMASERTLAALEAFSARGGHIIAEEGVGLRQKNTWLHSNWPSDRCKKLFGAEIVERVRAEKGGACMNAHGVRVPAYGFVSSLIPKHGRSFASWCDGRSAGVSGQNTIIGTAFGASFIDWLGDRPAGDTNASPHAVMLMRILSGYGIASGRSARNGVYTRDLTGGERTMTFVFNRTAKRQRARLPEGADVCSPAGGDRKRRGLIEIAPFDSAVYIH